MLIVGENLTFDVGKMNQRGGELSLIAFPCHYQIELLTYKTETNILSWSINNCIVQYILQHYSTFSTLTSYVLLFVYMLRYVEAAKVLYTLL